MRWGERGWYRASFPDQRLLPKKKRYVSFIIKVPTYERSAVKRKKKPEKKKHGYCIKKNITKQNIQSV